MAERIINDENHQGTKRIYGVPTPYLGHEAVNKDYVDKQIEVIMEEGGVGGGGFAPALMLMGG